MTNKEWAMKMIPVLIRWAQGAWDKPHYYSDLSAAIGHTTYHLGAAIGIVQDIIDDIKKRTNRNDIPTLNCFVCNKLTNLPSDGFDYVIPNYSKLSNDSKRGEVNNLNYIAHKYDWDWVLKYLKLKPSHIFETDQIDELKSIDFGSGGEGEEHKSIKEYIKHHPESLGIKNIIAAKTEYDLLSGDRLDVYFDCSSNKHFAIEVKPSFSSDAEITRGIFQCIKYQAIMDAMRVVENKNYDNYVLLVTTRELSPANKQLAADLSVKYIDNFQIR